MIIKIKDKKLELSMQLKPHPHVWKQMYDVHMNNVGFIPTLPWLCDKTYMILSFKINPIQCEFCSLIVCLSFAHLSSFTLVLSIISTGLNVPFKCTLQYKSQLSLWSLWLDLGF